MPVPKIRVTSDHILMSAVIVGVLCVASLYFVLMFWIGWTTFNDGHPLPMWWKIELFASIATLPPVFVVGLLAVDA